MRVVFLTGIWPPDVGGPATHGPDFAAFGAPGSSLRHRYAEPFVERFEAKQATTMRARRVPKRLRRLHHHRLAADRAAVRLTFRCS